MKNFFTYGEKIFLRAVDIEDSDFLAWCFNSPYMRETFFTNLPTNFSVQEEIIRKLYKNNTEYVPFIICDKQTEESIGITAFHRIDFVSRAAIFSIIIPDKDNWGKGFGKEATKLMVDYGFNILNLNRIQLHVFAENKAAISIYESVGFSKEGLLRQAMYHNNKYCDFYVMAILREDFYKSEKGHSV